MNPFRGSALAIGYRLGDAVRANGNETESAQSHELLLRHISSLKGYYIGKSLVLSRLSSFPGDAKRDGHAFASR